jgi:ATP/maltotriose-dependent transcriptional regulator MalT
MKTHLDLLFDKLGVTPRAQAVATGVRRGLLLV